MSRIFYNLLILLKILDKGLIIRGFHRISVSRMLRRMAMKVLVMILIISTGLAMIGSIYAMDERAIIYDKRLLDPVAELLSGPVWLRIRGYDIYESFTRSESLASAPAQAPGLPIRIPYREPSPKFSRNLLISIDVGRIPYQAETCLAVNPRDPDNLVIGLNDYGFYAPSAYVSMDGGETWSGPHPMVPLQKDDFGSDVSLAFDRNGTVYFAYMSIGWKWVRTLNVVVGDEKASIVVSKSVDGGETWSAPRVVAVGDIYAKEDEVVVIFLDRPRIAVGPDPFDKGKDRIYVTYTEFVLRYPLIPEYPYIMAPLISTTIKLVYSTDGGKTWSAPKQVSPTFSYWAGEERRRVVQGSNPKVAEDGRLYVAYYDSLNDGPWDGLFAPTIVWSDDGGETFSKPIHVDHLLELDYELPPTLFRAWVSMMPQIDVGPNGEVYLVVAARPGMLSPDDSDIFFYRSLDRGKTWSSAKRINDDETTRDQFIPAIAVSPNGTIHVAWGDRRHDPKDVEYHIYYTKSSDRGETWIRNVRVTDSPSNPNFGLYLYIGDYWSIEATDEDVYIAWTDTRLGRPESPNMKIGFARSGHIPLPTILISPPAGAAGQKVTIIGENFIPDKEVYIQVGDAYVSVARTDYEGKFKVDIFMPMLGEGPYRVRAIDVSGNRAEGYFYAEFGMDTIKKTLRKHEESYQEMLDEILKLKKGVEEVAKKIEANSSSRQELISRIEALRSEVESLTQLTHILAVLLIISAAIIALIMIKVWRMRK